MSDFFFILPEEKETNVEDNTKILLIKNILTHPCKYFNKLSAVKLVHMLHIWSEELHEISQFVLLKILDYTLSTKHKEWFISNVFETSQSLRKFKQQTSFLLKN